MRSMFETRSHSWQEAGLARQLSRRAIRRAWLHLLVLIPLLAAVLLAYSQRRQLFGADLPVRVATVVALLMIDWSLARDAGRLAGPVLFRRMDPATAGTVGFLIRLVGVLAVLMAALRIAGLRPQTLALGGAFTAVILGLAAQQTIGNLFAGLVLLSARPFRVGDRVRLQGGPLAGKVEGVVSSLGLLYTSFDEGDDTIMVPNSTVLNVAVVPLREPAGVDLRARLPSGITPSEIESLIAELVQTPIRGRPTIALEELDGEEIVVRISALPLHAQDGPRLATEVLEVVARESARPQAAGLS